LITEINITGKISSRLDKGIVSMG